MRIGVLITARLKSSRLKLKLLKPLNGYSVIERVIQRTKMIAECDEIVLCTSSLNQDLPLCRIAKKNDIYYFNGHAEDVLRRLLDAAELYKLDHFIGMTADNPLFSIYHANIISDLIRQEPIIDYIYTTGMPIGVNVYAMKVQALKTICEIKQEVDTEIWGYLINRPDIFNVQTYEVDDHYKFDIKRITLDEFDDYRFFKEIYKQFSKEEIINILEVYDLLKKYPEIKKINEHVIQRDLEQTVKDRINIFFKENRNKILDIKEKIYRN